MLERDRYRCVNCGHRDATGKTLQVDHIRDKARHGPALHLSDYQTLCAFGKGQGGCHRDKTAIEAAERAAQRRGTMTQTKKGRRRAGLIRQLIGYTMIAMIAILVLIAGLWALNWGADNGIVDRSYYDTAMAVIRAVLVAAVVVVVVCTGLAVWILRHRSNRSTSDDQLNATLAPVFGYPTGVRSIQVHKRGRTGPVEWTVMYPATNADEAPGWAADKVAKTTGRVGFPVKLVSLDVLHDRIRMRKVGPGEAPDAGPATPAVDDATRQTETERILRAMPGVLGIKEKERTGLRVRVVAWNPDRAPDPAEFTVDFPASVETQNWTLRSNVWEKVSDMYPGARWGADWNTAVDRLTFTDLGPDPLATPVGLPELPDVIEDAAAYLQAVPVGLREDSRPWTLRVRGRHILVAGESGSGKGSVLWNLIRSLLPLVRSGHVVIYAIDPKGGMELIRPGKGLRRDGGLFERIAVPNRDAADLLEKAEQDMKARANTLDDREHTPTPDDPHVVIIVDELLNPTVIEPRRDVRERFEAAMVGLLSAGRAVGYTIVAATQKPDKDTTKFRDLFTLRVCLRVTERTKVTMVLRDDSRSKGARADAIPAEGMEGTGYVIDDDPNSAAKSGVERVRAGWVKGLHIGRMVEWLAKVTAEDQAAQLATAAAAEPVKARDAAEGMRLRFEEGPGVVVGAEPVRPGRTAIDYHLDDGEIAGIEVDDGDEFERA